MLYICLSIAISEISGEMGRQFPQWCGGLSVRLRPEFPHHGLRARFLYGSGKKMQKPEALRAWGMEEL